MEFRNFAWGARGRRFESFHTDHTGSDRGWRTQVLQPLFVCIFSAVFDQASSAFEPVAAARADVQFMSNKVAQLQASMESLQAKVARGLSWLGMAVGPLALLYFTALLIGGAGDPGAPINESERALQIAVWEDHSRTGNMEPADAAGSLAAVRKSPSSSTGRSTNDFWFSFTGVAPAQLGEWQIEFPSRHALALTCWGQEGFAILGTATRDAVSGHLVRSRAGFALESDASLHGKGLICRGQFEGPAKISVVTWLKNDLRAAQAEFERTGSMIEAGIGVLALFMLITAVVNRSSLYLVFFGWLVLSMRMASLSAGTDFLVFGQAVAAQALVPMRGWTVGLYYAMTFILFSRLFESDLAQTAKNWLLMGLQLSVLVVLAVCALLPFQHMLPVVWVAVPLGVVGMLYLLSAILLRNRSRVAIWYAAAILVTLVANLNEVLAASLGLRTLLWGLNSVTAAVASAFMASVAVAEHMRADRIGRLNAQESLKTAYEDSPIGLFTLGADGFITKMNREFRSQLRAISNLEFMHFGAVFGSAAWTEVQSLFRPGGRRAIELQARAHAEGTPIDEDHWFAIKASKAEGDVLEGSLQDITDKVNAMARLEFLASHDPLTQCLNLRGMAAHFGDGVRLPQAIAYFDLDRFKLINDLYGHAAGDGVLKQVCERMQSQLRDTDMLARVGGDEFVAAFSGISMAEAKRRSDAIVKLIYDTPYVIDTQSFTLSISGGLIETARFGATTLRDLVSAADSLCRLAKKQRGEHLLVVEGDSSFFKFHKEQIELIACLERGETPPCMFIVMQPVMSLSAPYESLNFEVLVRQRKANGDMIPASVLIDTAEAYGKIAIIDRWVVTTVIEWIEAHIDQLPNTRFVGVNLSAGSLNDESFVEELFALFAKHERALSLMCLEITESVALTDIKNMQRLIRRAQALGAKVAIDDFGAGYSSFAYIKGLSADALKLDGSLVKDAPKNLAGMVIIEAIAGIASSLGMRSVGEFAEDLPTIQALSDAGISYAQGYGVSKPVSPERILRAQSCVDLIEDPAVLMFVQAIRDQSNFVDSGTQEIRSLH